ncbi:RAxF-45 family protein [Heyndrickxia camelliae]|nr:RAxF-45 family protein [Heyndrickxia camelliae]
MNQAVFVRGQWMEHLYICRAIFHAVAINGISMPIFSNCIWKQKR